MGWRKVVKGEREPDAPRVTMSMVGGGRYIAPVLRMTFRHPPEWLQAGCWVDFLIGTDEHAGKLMVCPGDQHKIVAAPTPGKKPTGVVQTSMRPWLGLVPSYQPSVEVPHEIVEGDVMVTLPVWALPGYQPSEAELIHPPTRSAVARQKAAEKAAAEAARPKPPAPVDRVATARTLPPGNPNIPILLTWPEAVAEAADDGITLMGMVQLGQWNQRRRSLGFPPIRIKELNGVAA